MFDILLPIPMINMFKIIIIKEVIIFNTTHRYSSEYQIYTGYMKSN